MCGLVQIPCIERNAFAACRALDAQLYASFSDGSHRVSFDRVVEVMKQTGHDIRLFIRKQVLEVWQRIIRCKAYLSVLHLSDTYQRRYIDVLNAQ